MDYSTIPRSWAERVEFELGLDSSEIDSYLECLDHAWSLEENTPMSSQTIGDVVPQVKSAVADTIGVAAVMSYEEIMTIIKPVNTISGLYNIMHAPTVPKAVAYTLQLLECHGLFWTMDESILYSCVDVLRKLFLLVKDVGTTFASFLPSFSHLLKSDDEVLKSEAIDVTDGGVLHTVSNFLASIGIPQGVVDGLIPVAALLSVAVVALAILGMGRMLDVTLMTGALAGVVHACAVGIRDWKTILESMKSTWEYLANALGRFLGFTYIDDKKVARQSLVDKLDTLLGEIKDLEDNMRTRFSVVVKTPGFFGGLRKRVDAFDKLMTDILRSTDNLSSFKFKIDDLRERITKLEELYETMEASVCGKQQPTTIYIYGKPGVGKSTVAGAIVKRLSELEGRTLTSYVRSSCDEYWSGYAYQDVVVYDDFGSSKEEHDLTEMISIYSPNAMLLNMAALPQKGTHFKSRYVIVCSNQGYINRSAALYNPEALARRRDFVFEATTTLAPHVVAKSEGEALDHLILSEKPRNMNDVNFKSDKVNIMKQRGTGFAYDFDSLFETFYEHQKTNARDYEAKVEAIMKTVETESQSMHPAVSEIQASKKKSILIIGPAGCGKTVLANKFRKDVYQDDFTLNDKLVEEYRKKVMTIYDRGGEDIILTTNPTRWERYLTSLPEDERSAFLRRMVVITVQFNYYRSYATGLLVRHFYTEKDISNPDKKNDYNKMVTWCVDGQVTSYEGVQDIIRDSLSVQVSSTLVHDCVPRMALDDTFKSNVVSFKLKWCEADKLSPRYMTLERSKYSYTELAKYLIPVATAFQKHFVPQQTLEKSLRGLNALRVQLPLPIDFIVNFTDASFLLTVVDDNRAVFAIIDDAFEYRRCETGIECLKDGVVVWTATDGPVCAWYESVLRVREPSEIGFDCTDLSPVSIKADRWVKMLMQFLKTAAASASIYQLCNGSSSSMETESIFDPYSNKMQRVEKKVSMESSKWITSENISPDGNNSRASSRASSVDRQASTFTMFNRNSGKGTLRSASEVLSENISPDGNNSRASSRASSVDRQASNFTMFNRNSGKGALRSASDVMSENISPDGNNSRASSRASSVDRQASNFTMFNRNSGKGALRSACDKIEEVSSDKEEEEEYVDAPLDSQTDPHKHFKETLVLIEMLNKRGNITDKEKKFLGISFMNAVKRDLIDPRMRNIKFERGVEVLKFNNFSIYKKKEKCRPFEDGHFHTCVNCGVEYWHRHFGDQPFHPQTVGSCPHCPTDDEVLEPEMIRQKGMHSEVCVDVASRDLMRTLISQNYSLCANGLAIAHAQGIYRNIFVTVAHATLQFSNLTLLVKGKYIPIEPISVNHDRDLMIFSVPNVAVRDIRCHLQEARVGKSLQGYVAALGLRLDDCFEVRPFVLHEEVKLLTTSGNHTGVTYSVSAYSHLPVQTKAGDCGSPLVIVNSSIQRKFLGVHIAANTNKALCSPVFLSDFDGAMSSQVNLNDVEILPFQKIVPADEEEFRFQNPDISPMYKLIGRAGEIDTNGDLIYHELPKTTMTQFYRSPFHTQDCEESCEPNVKDGEDWRLEKKFDIFAKAFNVYAHEQPEIDMELMQDVVDDVASYVAQMCARTNLRAKIFNMDEAINGCNYLPLSNPINRQSAPGYPHMVEENMKGKRKEVMVQMDENTGRYKIASNVQGMRLENDIEEFLQACNRGEKTAMAFVASLKDECVKRSKIEIGKTRAFTACPTYFTLAHRMYFGAASAIIANAHHELPIKVGIDAGSREFADLYNYLLRSGDVGFASDYKNWDGSMPAALIALMPRIWNKIYKECDPDWNEDDDRMRNNIHRQLQKPLVLYKHWLVQCPGGMMSGQPATAIENCFMNMCFYQYIWAVLARKHSRRNLPFARFRECVSYAVYGDDNLCTIHPSVRAWFNAKNFATECEKLGLTVTSADKTGDLAMQPLDELTFLKRSFTRINGQVVGALETDTFTKMLSWTKCGKRHYYHRGEPVKWEPTTITMAASSCLTEASLHGEEFYDEIAQHIKICAQQWGIELDIIPPWKQAFHSAYYRESLKLPTIPKNLLPFLGEKDPLSNMYRCSIPFEGRMWHSSEQIYQYKKACFAKNLAAAARIAESTNGFQAKRIGRGVFKDDTSLEEQWSKVKVRHMRRILKAKFNLTALKDYLSNTGESYLIEANRNDVFWGCGVEIGDETISTLTYPGLNWMGKLLMELRVILSQDKSD